MYIAVAGVAFPETALAHVFGARYELPLPLWFWLMGAGTIVALSFVLAGVLLRRGGTAFQTWRLDILRTPFLRLWILVQPIVNL